MTSSSASTEYQWRRLGAAEPVTKADQDTQARGYEAGYQEGMAAAQQAHAQQVGEVVQRLASVCEALTEQADKLHQDFNAEVISLVQLLFAHLLDVALFESADAFSRAVELLTSELTEEDTQALEIQLHPDDYATASSVPGVLNNELPVAADASVPQGAVRLISGFKVRELNPLKDAARMLSALGQPADE